ncbi:MAG: sulfite exporter TauE/SafE family protein [Acidimicrobiia bacterium]|nr:sulfite exporter TauE/SafE family protein [Acidimicrobiia bacterium]
MGFSWVKALVVGLVAGFVAGLLGIGGGVIVVPGLVLLVGMTQYAAAATSVATIVLSAAAAVVAFGVNGNVDWAVALVVFVGSSTGAWFGARYQDRIPEWLLAGAFSIIMVISAIRMWL